MLFNQQWHGYRRGHQLLASTVELTPRDQDLVDKLSDASGSPRPGERFEPYLTIYPLPSGRYHVIARTWQDFDAPRSGTVFTRSLLVPMETWRAIESVRPIFDSLDSREITNSPTSIEPTNRGWPPTFDSNLTELAEVLFLERAGAVAGFGFNDAETITGRLLEALWPSRRGAMAVCTYALRPRSLVDRDFDLVFAPETARSRFAKWGGRRVGASKTATSPRHAWTTQLVDRVFHDPKPNLQDLDEIGALDSDARVDSSALRLTLLWADLKKNAAESPKSLLGMLDVLRSLGRRPWDLPYLPDLITRTVNQAVRTPTPETWQFLQLLVRKLGRDIPLSIVRTIRSAAKRLASEAPGLIANGTTPDAPVQPIPHLLRSAVAHGLTDLSPKELAFVLGSIAPDVALALMAESPPFARAVTRSLSFHPNRSIIDTLASLADEDKRATKRFARGVARGALADPVAPLLRVALGNLPHSSFGLLASDVLGNGGSGRADLLNVLIETSHWLSAQRTLCELALHAASLDEGDVLIVKLVRSRPDASWLIESLKSHSERLSKLLLELMERWADPDLIEIVNNVRNRDAALAAALSDLPRSFSAFTRLLRLLPPDPPNTAAVLRKANPLLSNVNRIAASMIVLDQLLSLDPEAVSDLVQPLLATAEPAKFINIATSTVLTPKQIGRNVAAIANSNYAAKYSGRVDLLTTRLIERRSGGYGRKGYDGWAALLREARHRNPEALVRSADAALDYSLNRPKEPAGAVVAAAFPVLHARLAKPNRAEIPLNLLTAMIYASIGMFADWDQAKSARHRIVDAFMRSTWEPAELLRAGIDSNIPHEILEYLVSKKAGREYLGKIERSSLNYPESIKKSLRAALEDFSSKIP